MPDDLAALIRKHPRVLPLLREHGIEFCAGCFLTLTATPDRAAAYHGVPDIPRFLRAVDRVAPRGRRRSRRRRGRPARQSA